MSEQTDKQPAKEWPPITLADVCPTKTKGGREVWDGYNHPFTRTVSREEAQAREQQYYFDGSTCRAGHIAPRPISNKSACVDCHRVKNGLPLIGATARHQKFNAPGAGRPSSTATAAPVPAAAPAPREPDARDKRFLAALAETRDADAACLAVGATRPGIDARLSYDPVFRDAVRDLCERLLIAWTLPPAPTSFVWDETKRAQFIRVWVDTGDLATAREAVGTTPSDYFAELEANPDFGAAVEKAKPLAVAALEDRAHQLALAGNSKLLEKLLAAKKPEEYSDRIKLDVSTNRSLSNDQLIERFLRITRQLFKNRGLTPPGEIFEGEIVETPALESAGGAHSTDRASVARSAEKSPSRALDPESASTGDALERSSIADFV